MMGGNGIPKIILHLKKTHMAEEKTVTHNDEREMIIQVTEFNVLTNI